MTPTVCVCAGCQQAEALRHHVDRARTEAVLAFARWQQGYHGGVQVADAERYIQHQGWSETPGQAERGKP